MRVREKKREWAIYKKKEENSKRFFIFNFFSKMGIFDNFSGPLINTMAIEGTASDFICIFPVPIYVQLPPCKLIMCYT